MLDVRIKKVPDGKTQSEVIRSIQNELENYFDQHDNSCESYRVGVLNESNFDEVWEVQETYKNTPEIKSKYKNFAKEGKLVYVEIDY